jgi:hypothetical protein
MWKATDMSYIWTTYFLHLTYSVIWWQEKSIGAGKSDLTKRECKRTQLAAFFLLVFCLSIIRPWGWMEDVPLKCRYTFTGLCDIISQETVLLKGYACLACSPTLKMEAVYLSEMLVDFYQTTLHCIPDDKQEDGIFNDLFCIFMAWHSK